MKNYPPILVKLVAITIVLFILGLQPAHADHWYIKPNVGLSQMSDLGPSVTDISGITGPIQVNLDSGFNAGISLGRLFDNNVSVELGWEYRSNSSETILTAAEVFPDGNYAASSFFLNSAYFFETANNWRPYVGAGLVWLQEVDIDLERNGNELSYSDGGQTGLQFFVGVDYKFNSSWSAQLEARLVRVNDISLTGEEGAIGNFSKLNYRPSGLQLALKYTF